MKKIALTAALLILGVMVITPTAFADGDDGSNVFFGLTFGSPGIFYRPPPVTYVRPRPRVIRPPDGDRYRSYHRYDRDRRYREDRGYRGDENRDYPDHRYGGDEHWDHGEHRGDHRRDDRGDPEGEH